MGSEWETSRRWTNFSAANEIIEVGLEFGRSGLEMPPKALNLHLKLTCVLRSDGQSFRSISVFASFFSMPRARFRMSVTSRAADMQEPV